MRIVAIGDIGVLDGMLHVGDEAMFEALVLELRARGVTSITALSSNPSDSIERYGVTAIAGFGSWSADRSANAVRAAAVLDGSLAANDPAHAVVAAVRAADAVVIAGGGNMTSIWPSHIAERSTLGAVCAAANVPIVVSGQTLGPALVDDDAALLAGLLKVAALVGVRESDSLALAATLGTAAQLGSDDASFLADLTSSRKPLPPIAYCLVTLAGHTADVNRGDFVAAVAAVLDHVATTTGLAVTFSGHFAPLAGEPRGDEIMHELVRSAMAQPSYVARVTTSAESAALARGASLVVSSRYHPVVFAVSGGVPAIGIPVDDYTTTKLTGALNNFAQNSVLGVDRLLSGDGAQLVDDVWHDRESIRERGLARSAEQRAVAAAWWDRVAGIARQG